MFRPKVILHPTDFSQHSQIAFLQSVELAQQFGARLVVLHVVETLGPENVTFGEVATQLEPAGYQQRLLAEVRQIQPPPSANIVVEHLLAEGDPAAEIARVAREQGCGLIVMGTHGRTGLRRLVMGSVAEHVIRHAVCPVLVVPLPPAL
ncbi:MAG TPA: universal stress protein [Gemmataceae bacterium]|nr:universal stress protein [Gemmataceae bacterium]